MIEGVRRRYQWTLVRVISALLLGPVGLVASHRSSPLQIKSSSSP